MTASRARQGNLVRRASKRGRGIISRLRDNGSRTSNHPKRRTNDLITEVIPALYLGGIPTDDTQVESCLEFYRARQIGLLVCMLEAPELTAATAVDYVARVQQVGVTVLKLPTRDMKVPRMHDMITTARHAASIYRNGGCVLFQCHQGLGRSATMLAATMVVLGYTPEETINMIRQERPGSFLTKDQLRAPTLFSRALQRLQGRANSNSPQDSPRGDSLSRVSSAPKLRRVVSAGADRKVQRTRTMNRNSADRVVVSHNRLAPRREPQLIASAPVVLAEPHD